MGLRLASAPTQPRARLHLRPSTQPPQYLTHATHMSAPPALVGCSVRWTAARATRTTCRDGTRSSHRPISYAYTERRTGLNLSRRSLASRCWSRPAPFISSVMVGPGIKQQARTGSPSAPHPKCGIGWHNYGDGDTHFSPRGVISKGASLRRRPFYALELVLVSRRSYSQSFMNEPVGPLRARRSRTAWNRRKRHDYRLIRIVAHH